MGFSSLRLHKYWILFSCYLISISESSGNEGIFTGFAPKRIYNGFNSNYSIWIAGDLNGKNSLPPLNISITCSIKNTEGDTRSKEFPIGDGEYGEWTPNTPIHASIASSRIFAEVPESCTVNVIHLNTQKVLDQFPLTLMPGTEDNAAAASIFIQMDKPAYKPRDLVRIRLVTLNERNLPITAAPVVLTVRDAKTHAIQKVTEFPSKNLNGIIRFEFQLAKQLNFGEWTITAESGGVKEVRTFVVEKYILPKFLVKVVPSPTYLVIGDSTPFSVEIESSYTYGKPLAGTCSVVLYAEGNKPQEGKGNTKVGYLSNGKLFINTIPPPTEPGIYHIEANVSESKTGRWNIGSTSFQVFKEGPFRITWLNPTATFKPGFSMDIKLAISTIDNLPVSDIQASALSITSKQQTANTRISTEILRSKIPLTGMVTFRIKVPSDTNTIFHSIVVQYKNVVLNLPVPRAFRSTSKLQLNVFPSFSTNRQFRRGKNYQFTIEASEAVLTKVNYILYDGRSIIDFQVDNPISGGAPVKVGVLNVLLPEGVYTELRIFIFFVHKMNFEGSDTEEIVSASTTWATNNYIDLRLSREKVEPAEKISFTFRTHPNSTIALRGVDQSLLLLSRDETNLDLDPATVPYNGFWRSHHNITSSTLNSVSDFIEDFKNHGLQILTNVGTNIRRKRDISEVHDRFIRQAKHDIERIDVLDYTFHNIDVRTRRDFPEVWIWEEIETVNETTLFEPKILKVPDTMTSWYITAFSVNNGSGIAVTPFPKILQVFRPFFITLNLPYSVIKHEQFAFQVLVHNYLDMEIWATVTFINNEDDFQFIDSVERNQPNVTRHIRLAPQTVGVEQFVIQPLKLGHLPIHVRALTGLAGDAVIRNLNVVAPGVTYPTNQVKKLILPNKDGSERTQRIYTRNKRSLDSRSLQFTGDTLAPILEVNEGAQVSAFITLPTGCAEQKMALFNRNILALNYLQSMHKLSRERREAGIQNLNVGYQQQLPFYNADTGSFKYHVADKTPSTWLTAYILRWFAGARKYITIDDRILVNGLKYLVKQQNGMSGEIAEYGKDLYPAYFVLPCHYYLGGCENRNISSNIFRYAITAYVTLALAEMYQDIKSLDKSVFSETDRFNIQEAMIKGQKFISSDSSFRDSDAYSLAIVTATLHATNHSSMDRFYERLEQYAKWSDDKAFKHYEIDSTVSESQTTAMSIEITAYALLTNLWRSQTSVASSLPIVRWLFSKRKPTGTFLSTQDTVVAYIALSKYALMSRMQPTDAMNITIMTNSRETYNLQVSPNNSIAVQEFVLPADTQWLDITYKGQGRCCMEYQEYHYKSKINDDESQFKIKATWTPTTEFSDEGFYLELCVRVNQEEATGQSIAEVNLPSGYAFEGQEIDYIMSQPQERAKVIKNIEVKKQATRVNVYYDSINQIPTCIKLPVTRTFVVSSKYKAGISVYEYMDTNKIGKLQYDVAVTKTVCDICLESKGCDIVNVCDTKEDVRVH